MATLWSRGRGARQESAQAPKEVVIATCAAARSRAVVAHALNPTPSPAALLQRIKTLPRKIDVEPGGYPLTVA